MSKIALKLITKWGGHQPGWESYFDERKGRPLVAKGIAVEISGKPKTTPQQRKKPKVEAAVKKPDAEKATVTPDIETKKKEAPADVKDPKKDSNSSEKAGKK